MIIIMINEHNKLVSESKACQFHLNSLPGQLQIQMVWSL
jgi:hypothetical protein